MQGVSTQLVLAIRLLKQSLEMGKAELAELTELAERFVPISFLGLPVISLNKRKVKRGTSFEANDLNLWG